MNTRDNLRILIIRADLTYRELGALIGVSAAAIANWTSERQPVPEQRIGKLACALGVTQRRLRAAVERRQ